MRAFDSLNKVSIKPDNKMPAIKPFIKWVGGKGQLLDELEKLVLCNIGKVKKYAEPFVGGGALLFHLLSKYDLFEEIYISDINSELINAYIVIKNDVEALIEELSKLQDKYLNLSETDKKAFYYGAKTNSTN